MRWTFALCVAVLLTGGDPSARASPISASALQGVRPAFDPSAVRLPAGAPEAMMRAALLAGDPALARRVGDGAVGSAIGLDAEAALQRGRVLWLLAQASKDPTPHYRALFESHHPLGRWAGLRLAERLSRSDREPARLVAQSLARGWTGAARAQRLLARLDQPEVATVLAPAPVTNASELERAKQLIATQRYETAEALLGKLVPKVRADQELQCRASFELGRVYVLRKQRDKSAPHMLELASRCADPELRTWARYYAGQSKLRAADPAGAIEALAALITEAPSSSLADDALHMQSVAFADQGRGAEQIAALERIVAEYPAGDMRCDASFTLAMLARQRGDLSAALAYLAALSDSGLDDAVEGQEGRAQYWHARTLSDLGRRAEALDGYASIVRRYLQTYYAQLALGRLELLDPTRATSLRAELSTPASPLVFPYRAELDEAGFEAAIELLRVGEPDLAQQELKALNTGERDPSLLWLFAALFNEAAEHEHATRIARPLVAALLAQGSTPSALARTRALLRTAYPRAFAGVLEDAAMEARVPATLVRAVAREESSFDAEAQSPARAYGALQLIVPTARSIAKPLGLPSDANALKRPEINLRLGARFMANLLASYGGFAPLLPAAYNAGPGATERFLQDQRARAEDDQRPLALDAWVEAIPYRETRRYTRRVLQAYGFYRWLDDGELTSLPLEIPSTLRATLPVALQAAGELSSTSSWAR
jgi:soluble lytic murein transglycosylase